MNVVKAHHPKKTQTKRLCVDVVFACVSCGLFGLLHGFKARYEYTQRQRQHCCKCRCVLTPTHVCMRLNIHRGGDIDTYSYICADTHIHTRTPDDTVTTFSAHSHKTTIYSLPLMNEVNEAREKKEYNNRQNKTNACFTLTFTFL